MVNNKINNYEIICEKINDCEVLDFFRILGKKWVFPIYCRLNEKKLYSFEEIIKISKRKVHRNSLSKLLKEFIKLDIIEKIDNKYILTKKGAIIKKGIIQISKSIIKEGDCLLF